MLNRRDFLQVAAAAAALTGFSGSLTEAIAEQRITQDSLLQFEPLGNVTLMHITDCHSQLVPLYFREPSVNIGVGEVAGLPPHLTGDAFMKRFGIAPDTAAAYALTYEDFDKLAGTFGRVGGFDRLATLVKAIRAERPGRTLLLDGGDSMQGSYTSLVTKGGDMARALRQLGLDAITFHWEFTYGTERAKELAKEVGCPFLAGNILDTEFEEPVFPAYQMFERGGVKIAVIGQAFPYTPIANPRYLVPDLSFGIRESLLAQHVEKVRKEGAQLVVLLSHNGFDVDRKMVTNVPGVDVVLSGHTHDAVPQVVKAGKTLIVASGSHGKFLSRLDLDVQGGEVKDFRYRLIPVFSDAIKPDEEMARLVQEIRGPHEKELNTVVAKTEGLLYRRGNFNGTWDDVICDALRQERDAEISLSPGFRWGSSLPAGQDITVDHVYHQTGITYPNAYRMEMTGEQLKTILEDVADNLFNPDPYYQQGGDMVRVGGMAYTIDPTRTIGNRISGMTSLRTGKPIDASAKYVVSGWASVNEGTEGPPVYNVLRTYLEGKKVVQPQENRNVKVVGL